MVYVKTITDFSCCLPADRILEKGDMYLVYNGEALVGVFDVGQISIMYITKKKNDEQRSK